MKTIVYTQADECALLTTAHVLRACDTRYGTEWAIMRRSTILWFDDMSVQDLEATRNMYYTYEEAKDMMNRIYKWELEAAEEDGGQVVTFE